MKDFNVHIKVAEYFYKTGKKLEKKDIDEALIYYKRALRNYEEGIKIILESGKRKKIFKKIVKVSKKIQFIITKKAIERYTEESKKKPKDPLPLIKLAKIYEANNDFLKAIECVKKAIEKSPNKVSFWQLLEEYYAYLGDYEKAEECGKKAIEIKKSQLA